MALYEVVREIENSCSRNQMRDVFFEEIETDDPMETVRSILRAERNQYRRLMRRMRTIAPYLQIVQALLNDFCLPK